MNRIITIAFFLFLFCGILNISLAQNGNISPVASYTMDEGQVEDETGNTELYLYQGAELTEDPERGTVLRFASNEQSYATFSQQLLNTDTATFAFYFYWEEDGASSWHQLFEIHNAQTGSNLYLCPADGWNQQYTLFSDNKEYGSFEGVYGPSLQKNSWIHLAVTFEGKNCRLYVDGEQVAENYLMFSPTTIQGDSLYLAGNPYRSDNYYITARYDDIQIYHQALAANQVQALAQGEDLPETGQDTTSWQATSDPIFLELDLEDQKQVIRNFGASDAWRADGIGKYWPLEKRRKLAEMLFSQEKDGQGHPKGLGLSSWRFNIGAGTAEQGDDSRINNPSRRTEGFLNPDGETYDWTKQAGQRWFLEQAAKTYDVHHIIGWQNSPPVAYTKNNLGFREYDAPMSTILEQEHFDDFGRFLADVAEHFEGEGIHFDYISPLNEPQYGWSASSEGGTVTQEGTPWTNQEIYDVVEAIDQVFTQRELDTKLFIPEAGSIKHLLEPTGHAGNQLYEFWNPNSTHSLISNSSFADVVSYHSYWNDYGSQLVDQRASLNSRIESLDPQPEAWQTEFSFLGEGYRWGYPDGYKLTEMESALHLARVIVTDLNITQTSAWQWWTVFGEGKHGGETRFNLIEAFTNQDQTDGVYHANKLFYGFGNFTHFIRPGMHRIGVARSDGINALEAARDLMFSAFLNEAGDSLVVVAVNHTEQAQSFSLSLANEQDRYLENLEGYLTDAYHNLKKQNRSFTPESCIIPAQSIMTFTADVRQNTSVDRNLSGKQSFRVFMDSSQDAIIVERDSDTSPQTLQLYGTTGVLIDQKTMTRENRRIHFPAGRLPAAVYLVVAKGQGPGTTQKVVVAH